MLCEFFGDKRIAFASCSRDFTVVITEEENAPQRVYLMGNHKQAASGAAVIELEDYRPFNVMRAFVVREKHLIAFGNFFEMHYATCNCCNKCAFTEPLHVHFAGGFEVFTCHSCIVSVKVELPSISACLPRPT